MARRELTGGLVHTPFLTGLPNLISEQWRKFLSVATELSNIVPSKVTVTLENRSAAIGITPIPLTDLAAGRYRVTVYTKIRTAASLTSSVTPSIVFTDGSDVCTFTGTANAGNTVTSVTSNTWLVRIREGTPISYSTAYASNAAGMAYDLELVLEQIGL